MADAAPNIVDWAHFERSRTELGPGFIRILSYFREDGAKAIDQIEQAMREENTTALVPPLMSVCSRIVVTNHPGWFVTSLSRAEPDDALHL